MLSHLKSSKDLNGAKSDWIAIIADVRPNMATLAMAIDQIHLAMNMVAEVRVFWPWPNFA